MGVVWGTEGAQECQVLLKLGQGRAVSKGLLDLACILVLGSHGHHLRGIERAPNAARLTRGRVAEPCGPTHHAPPRRRTDRDERPDKRPDAHLLPQCQGLVRVGSLIGEHRDHIVQAPVGDGRRDAVVTARASRAVAGDGCLSHET